MIGHNFDTDPSRAACLSGHQPGVLSAVLDVDVVIMEGLAGG
jgi:hypothetical protein